MQKGVYAIINLVNNKRFVGISKDISHEWEKQKKTMKERRGKRSILQDFLYFGEKNFRFDIVIESDNDQELRRKANEYAYQYNVWINGYNEKDDVFLEYEDVAMGRINKIKEQALKLFERLTVGKYRVSNLSEILGISQKDVELLIEKMTEDELRSINKRIDYNYGMHGITGAYIEIKSLKLSIDK